MRWSVLLCDWMREWGRGKTSGQQPVAVTAVKDRVTAAVPVMREAAGVSVSAYM